MSNLLPINSKQQLLHKYHARVIFIVSLFLFVTAVIVGIALVPSYLVVQKDRTSLELKNASSSVPLVEALDRAALAHIRLRVDELTPLVAATSTPPSEAITTILALRPPAISIDHVSYSGGGTPVIVLGGVSKVPEQVGTYQESLVTSTRFKHVSVPVGALAGVNDGHFTITITSPF